MVRQLGRKFNPQLVEYATSVPEVVAQHSKEGGSAELIETK